MSMTQSNMQNNSSTSYLNATGTIRYNMLNDYMFRAVLQKNETVLKSLICSLLHLSPDSVSAIEIKNPIILGEAILQPTPTRTGL